MIAWLLHLIGASPDFLQHLDDVTLAFQHKRVLWIGFALLVPIGWYIVRRQRRNLATVSPRLRLALSALRIAVLALMVTILAGPYLKLDHQNERKPIVAFLFDHSESMQLPAGPFENEGEIRKVAEAAGYATSTGSVDPETRKALNRLSRAKLVHSVMQHDTATLLEPLAKKFDVQYYSFAKTLTPLGIDPAHPALPEPPNPGGPASHLGDAIANVLHDAGGRPVAGIVLFSDGQNTGGRSPAEVAAGAGTAGTPIFTVPAGTTATLRDVAIVDVSASSLVSVGDTARVAVTIESQGLEKRPVKVELREGDKLLDTKDLVLRTTEQQVVELTFQAKEPGPHYLTVHVPPLPEEPEHLRANNTDVAFVRVSEEKIKVLYLEGTPRWDFRFLKNAMRRDHGLGGRDGNEPDIVIETEWRRRTPDQQASTLPQKLDDLAKYHVVILGDVSPKLLAPPFVDLLVKAVRERGLGLVVEAGPQFMPHAFDTALQDLLPVKLRSRAAGREAPVYKPFRLEISPEGTMHEAMRLYDDPGRNQNAWEHMPPYYWCAAAERPAPAATVLAWNPNVEGPYGKLPLVASHYAGQGKVLFVGTDSTWLWRQNVGDRFFYKFWGQSIRFVARHDEKNLKKSWLEARPLRAQPGEQAQLDLMAFGADGTPRADAVLPVRVVSGSEAAVAEMTADPGTKGRYTGKFKLPAVGEYRFLYEPSDGAKAAEARVRVLASIEEMRHPNVNRIALDRIASASGGQLVELPELTSILDQFKGESKLTQLHREATIWDNWLTLALLVLLYSVDVGLRRLAGLS